MSRRESAELAEIRWNLLHELQNEYTDFIPFLRDGMAFLGFSTSEIQEDVGWYMQHGPDSLMVQAQRGQAKTTIAALYAVWTLIHNPKARVLIVSAGGTQASEISTLIVNVITTWELLECLAPDANAGDRTSVEHFDVHHSLKGVDKSPSVACVGITSNLQGKRADLLIADDVESSKNSLTALTRAQLVHLTLDFVSICMGQDGKPGRILWLGTPQSTDSIYNGLPGRGVAIRVWPGRYPTREEMPHYGEFLAPLLVKRMAENPLLQTGGGVLGNQGQPIDPSYLGEAVLQRKAREQGEAYFQLQHMLNTRLTDALRYPLKPERLIVMRLNKSLRVPSEVIPGGAVSDLRAFNAGDFAFRLNTSVAKDPSYAPLAALHMYVDPAPGGVNGDETGYAISGASNGNIFLFDVGGVPGGYEKEKLEALAGIAVSWGVTIITIEKNMGYGAFREVWLPILKAAYAKEGKLVGLTDDDYVTGQKERRIADTLEPILGRGSLVINEDVIERDWATTARYATNLRKTYSFFFQLAKLTRDRGALVHDDRLDATEGTCRYWQMTLGMDQGEARKRAEAEAYRELTRDPLGYKRYQMPAPRGTLARRLRR